MKTVVNIALGIGVAILLSFIVIVLVIASSDWYWSDLQQIQHFIY